MSFIHVKFINWRFVKKINKILSEKNIKISHCHSEILKIKKEKFFLSKYFSRGILEKNNFSFAQ